MDKTEIKAVEMVRAIRDQIHEETKHLTPEEFVEWIHQQAALGRAEREAARERARPAA